MPPERTRESAERRSASWSSGSGSARQRRSGRDARTPLASPLYADLAGLPPLLVQVGSAEILLDDAVRVAERARKAGVTVELRVWPDMIHVWHAFAQILPEGQQAVDEMAAFFEKRLA